MANAKNGYVTEDHEGKLYRVRDQDKGKGEAVIVWAENLPHEEASFFKERLVGAGKSRTARLEDMEIAPPPTSVDPKGNPIEGRQVAPEPPVVRTTPRKASSLVTAGSPAHANPGVQSARQKGLAVARAAAAQAQARAQVVEAPSNGEIEVEVPDNIEDELENIEDISDLPA